MGLWSESNHKTFEYTEYIRKSYYKKDFDSFTHEETKKVKAKKPVNRLLPIQPTQYETYHAVIKARYNLRKLSVLPFHLIEAGLNKSKNNSLLDFIKFNLFFFFRLI